MSGAEATPAFTTCVTSKAHAGWVESINTAADQRGVTGTPTLFLDGKPVDVADLTPTGLKTMIAEAARSRRTSRMLHALSIPSPSKAVWEIGGFPLRAYALCIIAGIIVGDDHRHPSLAGPRRHGGQPGTGDRRSACRAASSAPGSIT